MYLIILHFCIIINAKKDKKGRIMDNIFINLLFICPLLFIAGIIDAISGGGGIIALPAYIMTGMPLSYAYGCNKLQSAVGTSTALYRYARSGYVDFKAALIASIPAVAGAFISTRIMLLLDESVKSAIIIVAMIFVITLTIITNKVSVGDGGELTHVPLTLKNALLCLAVGFFLGLYDGFFGPGGGTIALMLFSIIFRYDFRTAVGNGKVIIVVSNLIALVNYIVEGTIFYEIAIPATIANIAGSYIGASLAVKNGKKLVKKFLLAVVAILIVQAILKLI